MKVAVVMSTYNGEKYLAEQLDSIFSQTGVDVSLFVRDDGSTDGTHAILAEYAEKHGNMTVELAQNVGVGNSFMNALYDVPDTFDYYAFADQDDIWLENKLIEAIKLLQSSGKALYASNQENVDKDGNSLGMRWEKDDKRVYLTPVGILNVNVICGCTMVFDNKFFQLIVRAEKRPSSEVLLSKNHDGWIAMVAAIMDDMIFDYRSFIKYRQHGNNVVGSYKASFRKVVKAIVKRIGHRELRNRRSNTARDLCEKFDEVASKNDVIKCSAEYRFVKRGKRNLLKHSREIRFYTGERAITLFLKIMCGLY